MQMLAIIISVVAGAAMSLQGVFNARLSEKIGLFESNVFVQGTALLFAFIAWIVAKNGSFSKLQEVNKLYWLGGLLGIVITITVMVGVRNLGPAVSVSIILIAQLLVAAIIDALGLFGTEKIPFLWTKWVGIALMVSGVVVFKVKL